MQTPASEKRVSIKVPGSGRTPLKSDIKNWHLHNKPVAEAIVTYSNLMSLEGCGQGERINSMNTTGTVIGEEGGEGEFRRECDHKGDDEISERNTSGGDKNDSGEEMDNYGQIELDSNLEGFEHERHAAIESEQHLEAAAMHFDIEPVMYGKLMEQVCLLARRNRANWPNLPD